MEVKGESEIRELSSDTPELAQADPLNLHLVLNICDHLICTIIHCSRFHFRFEWVHQRSHPCDQMSENAHNILTDGQKMLHQALLNLAVRYGRSLKLPGPIHNLIHFSTLGWLISHSNPRSWFDWLHIVWSTIWVRQMPYSAFSKGRLHTDNMWLSYVVLSYSILPSLRCNWWHAGTHLEILNKNVRSRKHSKDDEQIVTVRTDLAALRSQPTDLAVGLRLLDTPGPNEAGEDALRLFTYYAALHLTLV